MSIKENVAIIQDKIAAAAQKSGRRPQDITLVGVTKTVDAARVNELVAAGVAVLGENRVQELLEKYDHVTGNPQWHIIGHLQTNKVKQIIDKAAMVQSVDSLRLAEAINKYAAQANRVMDVLIEVNIEDEDTKYGIKPDALASFVDALQTLPNIRARGLMAIPPIPKTANFSRKSFEKLKRMFVDIQEEHAHNYWDVLSIGMSADFEPAIEEGATMVRVGTALFGPRLYT